MAGTVPKQITLTVAPDMTGRAGKSLLCNVCAHDKKAIKQFRNVQDLQLANHVVDNSLQEEGAWLQ